MIVRELLDLLEDADPDATVLLAHQPGWPLQFHVLGVYDAAVDEQPCRDHDIVDCDDCGPGEPNPFIYIVEGDHPDDTPYAPRSAWENATTA
jgi:hypothetical protein